MSNATSGSAVARLLLQTLPGLMDFLADEVERIASVRVVRRWPQAVLIECTGPASDVADVALFSTGAWWTGAAEGDHDVATRVVEEMRLLVDDVATRVLLPRDVPCRFRVGDIGEARWPVRDALVAAGFVNSTGDWDVNVETFDGIVVLTIGAMHMTRRFGALERIPASTNPVLSSGLARLAKIPPGSVVLDPFCGAGTNLLAAATRCPDATLVGLDVKARAVQACTVNVARRSLSAAVVQSSATRMPLADLSVDRVIANLPFGKRVGSHEINAVLYPAFLRELGRVLRNDGRAVLLTEDKRLFVASVQRSAGLKIVKESVFETGGLHPSAYTVERSRKQRSRS